jgi:hypothetical protein
MLASQSLSVVQNFLYFSAEYVCRDPDEQPRPWISKSKGKARASQEEIISQLRDLSVDFIPRRVVSTDDNEAHLFPAAGTSLLQRSESPLTPIEEDPVSVPKPARKRRTIVLTDDEEDDNSPPLLQRSESPLTPIEEDPVSVPKPPRKRRRIVLTDDEEDDNSPQPLFTPERTPSPPRSEGPLTPTIKWDNGMTTVLPWIEDPQQPGLNLLKEVITSPLCLTYSDGPPGP